jgi:branched-chain amino acid transport system permease protein
VIPLLLILVMIFRPTGLVAFKEFNPRIVFGPREAD